ncbi:MAG: tetratricopeptide repeat protein [Magnetococcales bacterium]|nr:tetratricopeptide repeat protein [Magnetococcales bacterium]
MKQKKKKPLKTGSVKKKLEKALEAFSKGKTKKTRLLCLSILRDRPHNPTALLLAGRIAVREGRMDEAVESLRRAVIHAPNNADTHQILGKVLNKLGDPEGAVAAFREAVRINNRHKKASRSLGKILLRSGQYAASETHLRQSLEVSPHRIRLRYLLGVACRKQNNHGEAERIFRTIIEIRPDHVDALVNLGISLREQGKLQEAESFLIQAASKDKQSAKTYANLALTQYELGFSTKAEENCNHSLQLEPNRAYVHWIRGQSRLRQGVLEDGWKDFEWRTRMDGYHHSKLPFVEWSGEDLRDRTILVYGEQGIGNEVMCASCLDDLINQAGKVILECDVRLVALFQYTFPHIMVVRRYRKGNKAWLDALPPVDFQISSASLPRYFRNSSEDFSGKRPQLCSDLTLKNQWQEKLASLGDGLKIGISWRGGSHPLARKQRSTELFHWAPLFNIDGVHWINVQYGASDKELAQTSWDMGVQINHFSNFDPLGDLNGFVALLSSLDLVISIDNNTVHFAGALEVPVWTLLPFAADWRWMESREDTPWYTSMRLFRQERPGDWGAVFNKVAKALQVLKDNHH